MSKVTEWPVCDGKYKVVQLYLDGEPKLYFADMESSLHCAILMGVLVKHNVPLRWMSVRGGVDVPVLQGNRYKVCGMGRVSVDVEYKTLYFSGESFHYGISIDWKHLGKIAEQYPEWKFERI